MKVLALTSPGRLPTTSPDPGRWWDAVAGGGRHELVRFSATETWWRVICSERAKALLLAPLGPLDGMRRRALWRSRDIALAEDGLAAGRALASLKTPAPFSSAKAYISALAPIARYLADFNRAQDELDLDVVLGPYVRGVDYLDSVSVIAYSRRDTFLSRTIEEALEECPRGVGFAAFSPTKPQDLLTALITARLLRAREPGIHLCLVDLSCEDFSLLPHLESLRASKAFEGIFDSIVESKDDRDDVVPALIEAAAEGRAVRGYVKRADVPGVRSSASAACAPPPPLPAFSPEAIMVTRLSPRRCYWSRCTFCVHNNKYDDRGVSTQADVVAGLDRVEAMLAAGYGYINFADEALSPAMLRGLALEIKRRGLKFHWVCRSKIEHAHTAELAALIAEAGCREIQFGLETTSERVLRLMDKHVEGLDEKAMAKAFKTLTEAGVGVHANLIAGFPGDALADTRGSVEFLIREFAGLRGTTFFVSPFRLLPETPIVEAPERFGVRDVSISGDLAQYCAYTLDPRIAPAADEVFKELPALEKRLHDDLGWNGLADETCGSVFRMMYFGSGHGSIFKARADNPFACPARRP